MGSIIILDKSISELIAAGEVVDRPASVVKELIENSIDAHATKIRIEIKNGGVTYIKITDNGHGISKDDIKYAFFRHATSKVKSINDLDNILTLGFRGEALSSISAVSNVEIITRTKNDKDATKYTISGNISGSLEDIGAPIGTTIIIRDLFFNVPARMKFLKKDVTEGNLIANIIDKLALSHPEISFTFIRDGQEKLSTFGDNKLISTIYSVLGKDIANNMLPLKFCNNNISLTGYICNPSESKMSRNMQNFFINSRYIKSKTCCCALEEAYKSFIVQGRFPSCVLNLSISNNIVDINVHPAKLEVRFVNEKIIYDTIYAGVKNCILSNSHNPIMKFKKSVNYNLNETNSSDIDYLKNNTNNIINNSLGDINVINNHDKKNNNMASQSINYEIKNSTDDISIRNLEIKKTKLNEQIEKNEITPPSQEKDISNVYLENEDSNCEFIGEIFNSYIIAEKNDNIIFIDKHAAHERIIFEKIKNGQFKKNNQILLTPITINLTLEEYQIALDNISFFNNIGFSIEDFGDKTIIIREIPIDLSNFNISQLIIDAINNLALNKKNITPEIINKMYYTIACKAAIKSGDKNNNIELKNLLYHLENHKDFKNCPHGRPLSFTVKRKDIEKQFLR